MTEYNTSKQQIREVLDDGQNISFGDLTLLHHIQQEGSVEKSEFSEEYHSSLDRLSEYGLVEFQTVASEKEIHETVYRLSDSLESWSRHEISPSRDKIPSMW